METTQTAAQPFVAPTPAQVTANIKRETCRKGGWAARARLLER